MLIESLTERELHRRLRGDGVHLVTGAFTFHVRASGARLAREIATMYGAYALDEPPGIDDAGLFVRSSRSLRHPLERRTTVRLDDGRMFDAAPATSDYAALESAMNWSIALSDVAPLLMHSAVLERDGRALVLPGAPGSGKSTLCAALACRGWRLFSDEMGVFAAEALRLRPNPRPVSLKNASIALIRAACPQAHVGEPIRGTPKGDVAYMRAPRESVERCREDAPPALVVSPRYEAGAGAVEQRLRRIDAFRLLTENAVNYSSMLALGFERIAAIAERCPCYTLTYSALDEGIAAIEALWREHARR